MTPPSAIPPVLARRPTIKGLVILTLCAALIVLAAGAVYVLNLTATWLVAAPLVAVVLVGLVLYAVGGPKRELLKRVRATNGLVCTYCGYDLAGRATPDVCPECGKAITDEQAQRAWGDVRGHA